MCALPPKLAVKRCSTFVTCAGRSRTRRFCFMSSLVLLVSLSVQHVTNGRAYHVGTDVEPCQIAYTGDIALGDLSSWLRWFELRVMKCIFIV